MIDCKSEIAFRNEFDSSGSERLSILFIGKSRARLRRSSGSRGFSLVPAFERQLGDS
jgi:hypothetical protein